jgi:small subunit ribosomal protein S12
MPTFNQLSKLPKRIKKKRNIRVPALDKKPQRRATCIKIFTTTPRKPNSALRKVARIRYRKVVKSKVTFKITFAYIQGIGHTLKEHAAVIFRGGRTQDLPGLKYKLVRGKLDFKALTGRVHARSKYGLKKPSK